MTAHSNAIENLSASGEVVGFPAVHQSRWRTVARLLRSAVRSVVPGAAAVAAITLLAFRFQLNITAAAFLHLIVVVLVARRAGFWMASVVSAIAVLGQLYFLVPPVLTFSVEDPQNWVALGAFEYCALVVSGLSGKATRQTLVANRQQQEAEGLYEVSRLMLLMDREREPGPQLTALIQRVFHCGSAGLFDAELVRFACSGLQCAELEKKTRDTHIRAVDWFDGERKTWFLVLRMGMRPVGALALQSGAISEAVGKALASLVAVALERAHAFEKESRAEAARQGEQLRTAVLDALAHEVKTPLTSIRAASSGLLEAGSLKPRQAGLIRLIDNEAGRLNEITNRLVGMARLDEKDVRLTPGSLRLDVLVRKAVTAFKGRTPGRAIRTAGLTADMMVAGDENLLGMGLAQLIDNAIKYSEPYSGISIGAERCGGEVVLSVHNRGTVIPPPDLERIFERFYRSEGTAQSVAGTGLGLSITRKIAAAHRGRVWATSDVEEGTTLFLALPAGPRAES